MSGLVAARRFHCMIATSTVLLVGAIFQDHFTIVKSFNINPDWYACHVEFKDMDVKGKAITDCATKHNYKLPTDGSLEALNAEMQRLSSTDFEDSCFSKCFYESSNMIKDGKINPDGLGTFYKNSNISEPLLKEYTKLFTDCLKETEPKFKDEKEAPCKMFVMVDYCCVTKFQEQKKHFEEICGKGTR